MAVVVLLILFMNMYEAPVDVVPNIYVCMKRPFTLITALLFVERLFYNR